VKIYFLTTNTFKIDEAQSYAEWREIGKKYGVQLSFVKSDVQEILHAEIEVIVRQKAVAAFAYIRHPCVVEHGGLFMDALPGLPGGLGKIVWDAVGDRICGFLRENDSREATARSYLGYCDGRRVRVYVGETRGRISDRARGDYKFAWDPIFIPENSDQTYGEMGLASKRATSPSCKAWDQFLAHEIKPLNVRGGPGTARQRKSPVA
jgi:XTP/dITP diphosphohydrolase